MKSYGVSMTTLEDVFLKINQEFAPELFGFDQDSRGSESELESDQKGAAKGYSIGHSTFNQSSEQSAVLKEEQDMKDSMNKGDDAEYLVRGSGACATLGATSTKRFIMYRRDWCGIICEVIVPIVMVIVGLQFASGASKLS